MLDTLQKNVKDILLVWILYSNLRQKIKALNYVHDASKIFPATHFGEDSKDPCRKLIRNRSISVSVVPSRTLQWFNWKIEHKKFDDYPMYKPPLWGFSHPANVRFDDTKEGVFGFKRSSHCLSWDFIRNEALRGRYMLSWHLHHREWEIHRLSPWVLVGCLKIGEFIPIYHRIY